MKTWRNIKNENKEILHEFPSKMVSDWNSQLTKSMAKWWKVAGSADIIYVIMTHITVLCLTHNWRHKLGHHGIFNTKW